MVAWGHLTLKSDYLFSHYSAIEKKEDMKIERIKLSVRRPRPSGLETERHVVLTSSSCALTKIKQRFGAFVLSRR